jgi:ribulose-phosphate 3-epimerase
MIIEPSILSANLLDLNGELGRIRSAGMDTIHVDIMDGVFAPNLTFGPDIVKQIKKSYPDLKQDCHLMVKDPLRWIKPFAEAGADYISFHIEAVDFDFKKCMSVISRIRIHSAKVGIAVNPSTDITKIFPFVGLVDFVLIMTVNPGFSGQSFIEDCVKKISTLKEKCPKISIQVDGGINLDTIKKCSDAGAIMFVSGSTLFKNHDMKEMYSKLKDKLT